MLYLFVYFLLVYFFFLMFINWTWWDYKKKEALVDVFLASITLGWLCWILYFYGISLLDPNTASMLLLVQIFFNFLFFNIYKKEAFSKNHIIWSLFMCAWAGMILYKWWLKIDFWALVMIFYSLVSTLWNYFVKKSRQKVSAIFISFNRNIIALFFVFILALFQWNFPETQIIKDNLPIIALIWIWIFGFSKLFWVETIHRLPMFTASSFLTGIPVLVMIFSYFMIDLVPTTRQLIAFIPIFIGSLLLLRK